MKRPLTLLSTALVVAACGGSIDRSSDSKSSNSNSNTSSSGGGGGTTPVTSPPSPPPQRSDVPTSGLPKPGDELGRDECGMTYAAEVTLKDIDATDLCSPTFQAAWLDGFSMYIPSKGEFSGATCDALCNDGLSASPVGAPHAADLCRGPTTLTQVLLDLRTAAQSDRSTCLLTNVTAPAAIACIVTKHIVTASPCP